MNKAVEMMSQWYTNFEYKNKESMKESSAQKTANIKKYDLIMKKN